MVGDSITAYWADEDAVCVHELCNMLSLPLQSTLYMASWAKVSITGPLQQLQYWN